MCGGPPGTNRTPATNTSGRKVFCVKFQKEPGLDAPRGPVNRPTAVRSVSTEAWKLWEERQR